MSFNFDQPTDRRNSNSIKWHHYAPDILPMWVADMDFRSPEPVIQALRDRVDHGVFGYEWPRENLLNTLCAWCERKYGWKIKPEDIVELPGLVSGLNVVARSFGYVGDSAITLTPVYPPFLSAPVNQGIAIQTVPMREHVHGQHFQYEIDFEAFERAITPRTEIFFLCHPHNPAGHEYSLEELQRLGQICIKHNLTICSDEIHCDLMLGGTRHVPMANVSPEIADRTVTLMAPSKTFNLPGLGFSFAVVQNAHMRARMKNAMMGIVPHTNALGMTAAEAAYGGKSDAWLDGLQEYLTGNRDTMLDYLAENLPDIKATVPNATYLGWLDCRELELPTDPYAFFLEKGKVALNSGPTFGPGGAGFARINFGTPRPMLLEGLERMKKAVDAHRTGTSEPQVA